jgi:hypothetical protein
LFIEGAACVLQWNGLDEQHTRDQTMKGTHANRVRNDASFWMSWRSLTAHVRRTFVVFELDVTSHRPLSAASANASAARDGETAVGMRMRRATRADLGETRKRLRSASARQSNSELSPLCAVVDVALDRARLPLLMMSLWYGRSPYTSANERATSASVLTRRARMCVQ